MQRVNELFGKEVVRQTSGEKQGNVRDIVFDEESLNIVALLVGGTIGRGRALRWTSVASVGDVVVVGGEEALGKLGEDPEVANLHKKSHTLTGTEIVTQEGEKIGEVRDIFVNERGQVGGYEVSRGMVSDLRGDSSSAGAGMGIPRPPSVSGSSVTGPGTSACTCRSGARRRPRACASRSGGD